MTPQEAIKILKPLFEHCKGKNECLGYIEHFFTKDEEEALDIAIKALEQQPCEDAVSRQAVLGLAEQYPLIIGNRYSGLIADIKHLPSVTPSYNSIKTELEPCDAPRTNLAETSQDCISRKAVKEMLTAEWTKYMPMESDVSLSFVLEKISELPSVTPRSEWIPCSEKMPDINIHVLAQFVMGGMAECYYAHNWWHIVGGFRISGDEVIAWMPLPQPYKAESEG